MQFLLEGDHRDVVNRHPTDSVRDGHGGWNWKRINEGLDALHEHPVGWKLMMMRSLRRRDAMRSRRLHERGPVGAAQYHRPGGKSGQLHELATSHQRARRNRGTS